MYDNGWNKNFANFKGLKESKTDQAHQYNLQLPSSI